MNMCLAGLHDIDVVGRSSNRCCAECNRDRDRKYRETHREERRARDRKYRETHREERRARDRVRYESLSGVEYSLRLLRNRRYAALKRREARLNHQHTEDTNGTLSTQE